jgi:hypothetical protein
MLRSILNSVRGKSCMGRGGAVRILGGLGNAGIEGGEEAIPYVFNDFSSHRPQRSAPAQAFPSAPVAGSEISAAAVKPDRCCVYCGHGLYAPPRIARVRCPRCFAEMPIRDILLTGDGELDPAILGEPGSGAGGAPQVVTGGKITVAPGARVAAELVACTIDVSGMVLGDIIASQTCRVRSTGKLAGRILCRYLMLEPGAEVEGAVELIRGGGG